jgi:hypothetical protein
MDSKNHICKSCTDVGNLSRSWASTTSAVKYPPSITKDSTTSAQTGQVDILSVPVYDNTPSLNESGISSTTLQIRGRLLEVSMRRAFDNCYHLTLTEDQTTVESLALRIYWDVNDLVTENANKSPTALPYTLLMTSVFPAPPEGLLLKSSDNNGHGPTAERYTRMGYVLGPPPREDEYWSDGESDGIDSETTWDWSLWAKVCCRPFLFFDPDLMPVIVGSSLLSIIAWQVCIKRGSRRSTVVFFGRGVHSSLSTTFVAEVPA